MSLTIELSDELVDRLDELALMWGFDEFDGILKTLSRCIELADQSYDQTPEGSLPNSTIHDLVSSITEFNAAGPVTITEPPPSTFVAATALSFDQLKKAYPSDRLIKDAAELDELAQQSLARLYSNIPLDLWGTVKAETLWNRQREFDARRAIGPN